MQTATPDTIVEPDVLCPLCGYNLRGLPEARCPECGGKFDWLDLTDPTRKLHPYLFEHHPERNLKSFVRTVLGGIFPRRFWQTIHPAQPSRPRRLLLYWFVVSFICLLVPAAIFVQRAIDLRAEMLSSREWQAVHLGIIPRPQNFRWRLATATELAAYKQQWGSVQAFLDKICPEPTFKVLLQQTPLPFLDSVGYAGLARGERLASIGVYIGFMFFLWPWVAALLLMMLRATMRQASVRPSHLFRVTIYSFDIVLWLLLLQLAPLVPLLVSRVTDATRVMELNPWIYPVLKYAPYVTALVLTYRFAVAIRSYLRFRHAVAVAISVQIIIGLVLLQAMAMIYG